jgi:O-antigen/teichoic acid export membrane protein
VNGIKKQLALVYAGYFFRYVYLLILIPYYARTLGAQAYGVVVACMSVYAVVWTIQNWGFSFVGSRNIATVASSDQGQTSELARHLTARLILTPVSVLFGIIAISQAPLLREHPIASFSALFCGVLAGFNVGWFFQGRMNFNTPVLIEIVGFASMLAMVLLLVHQPADNILIMPLLTLSTLLALGLAYYQVSKLTPIRLASLSQGWGLIKESTPLFITGATGTLMINAGTYALAMLATSDQVAYFGTAEKVITTGLALLAPAGQVFMTWFSKMKHESQGARGILGQQLKAIKWVVMAGGGATIACLTFVPIVLDLALGEKFVGASSVLKVLSPIFLLAAFNQAVSVYLLIPQRLDRAVSLICVLAALIGVVLTVAGAMTAGAMGAAVGRVIGEAVNSLLLMGYCYSKRKMLFAIRGQAWVGACHQIRYAQDR